MIQVSNIVLMCAPAIALPAPAGFDAAGAGPLQYSKLLDMWPRLLKQGSFVENLEVTRHTHIPYSEPVPDELAQEVSAAVPDLLQAVARAGPGSGHAYQPLLYRKSVKLRKANCQGADTVAKAYPGWNGGEEVEKDIKRIIQPGAGYKDKKQGFSAVIMDMNFYSAATNRACSELQQFHGSASCHSNWYITPSGSCTYKPHMDLEENFVVQLTGSKMWRIYNTTGVFPFLDLCASVDDCWHEVDTLDAVRAALQSSSNNVASVIMRPGDLLYLPRGRIHEAASIKDGDSVSISSHITFAVQHGMTWTKLLLEMFSFAQHRDKKFKDDTQAYVCGTKAGHMSVKVNAAAATEADQISTSCPNTLMKFNLRWGDLCMIAIKFAAHENIAMRRMLRVADEQHLESGLQASFEIFRNILEAPSEILCHGSCLERHPMVGMLNYAAAKGFLGPEMASSKQLGLTPGGWLIEIGRGLQQRMDVFCMGGITSGFEQNRQGILSAATLLVDKYAKAAERKSRKFNEERMKDLHTPYEE